jgi:hypothetical protein
MNEEFEPGKLAEVEGPVSLTLTKSKISPQLLMAVAAGLSANIADPKPYHMRSVLDDAAKAVQAKKDKKEKKARKLAAKMQRKNHK